ncbi:hypothetical protein ACSQ67_016122 [Phaseolus vulgaris]
MHFMLLVKPTTNPPYANIQRFEECLCKVFDELTKHIFHFFPLSNNANQMERKLTKYRICCAEGVAYEQTSPNQNLRWKQN